MGHSCKEILFTGQGSISSVPAGSSRTVVILEKNADGNVIFSGQKSNIDVVADSENNAGTIECFGFVPNLQAPLDESEIEGSAIALEWIEVSGADQYRVVVSHNSDLSDPIIQESTNTTNFTPTGLSYRKTCYWQVYAIDAYGNSGIGSAIWSFRSPGNVSPFAQITCPTDSIIYVEGDMIEFAGSGSDINEGDLSGESLVWSSDLYGQIGTGQTCSSELLGAGIHQISLTATDSDGLSWTDTVAITVNAGSAVGSLPDTGQSTSHTDTFGDDSDYTINPPADTKLDASGNALDACAAEWAMVRINVTGLVWEVKTDDGSIHDKDDIYDWKKDQAGDLDAHVDFIDRLNSQKFGGYNVECHRFLPS